MSRGRVQQREPVDPLTVSDRPVDPAGPPRSWTASPDAIDLERRQEVGDRLAEEPEAVVGVGWLVGTAEAGQVDGDDLRSAIASSPRERNDDVGQPWTRSTGGPEPSSR